MIFIKINLSRVYTLIKFIFRKALVNSYIFNLYDKKLNIPEATSRDWGAGSSYSVGEGDWGWSSPGMSHSTDEATSPWSTNSQNPAEIFYIHSNCLKIYQKSKKYIFQEILNFFLTRMKVIWDY